MGDVHDIAKLAERDDLNVVFILIDTLRADRLSANLYDRPTSPNLNFLSDSGIRFSNVVSQSSWTKVSMSSMWTGTYPQRTRILRYPDRIPEAAHMPAEIFKEEGYHTVGIYRNGWVAPTFGFAQGFDQYLTPSPSRMRKRMQAESVSAARIGGTDEDITNSAVEYLKGVADEKFFLYLHYMDVHQFVYTPEVIFGSTLSDIYDSSIAWTDSNVGRVVLEIFEQGLLDNTVIIILSDHGEAFMEHGREGHARDVYREVTSTPFILSLPIQLKKKIVVEERVANVDLWPTIFDMLGFEGSLAQEYVAKVDGRSLMPLIKSSAGAEAPDPALVNRDLFTQLDTHWGRVEASPSPLISLQSGPYRYYYWVCDTSHSRLFDHSKDPTEQVNVIQEYPERAAEMEATVKDFLTRMESPWGGEAAKVELDEMQLGQLRALGYVLKPGEESEEIMKDCEKPEQAKRPASGANKQGFKWDMQGVEINK
jgi:arylsulfatase A-like enzyme